MGDMMRHFTFIAAIAAASPSSAAPATSPAAARAVVQNYYAALDAHAYRTAYALWDQNGAASSSFVARAARPAMRRNF